MEEKPMWRELTTGIYDGVGFREPVTSAEFDRAEQLLEESIPVELKELLSETDGITGHTGTNVVWPLERIIKDNQKFRRDRSFADLYMPFDPLLFFGDNGGGDHFAFVMQPVKPDIFVWQHESDSRKWVASDLQDYLERCLVQGGDDWYENY
ncbi:SMI1/KNR4 family protein [Streptomyces sp. NBC_00094]|uniref:SMI1/KNR4 family protein n=1 Tax=Streptomyces sp. NBC_00094 TaxID=2903620 RepID=UPI00224FC24D|nr:SMI1/KNR4 family protein [Streptomyces sp. NBC_00094]MCX5390547.1 SMI1/KNR4 family protein [Streptomyces sp. NBC_00094]